MKILFITQFLPYYPDTGGKVKSWRMLSLLANKHKIWLVSFVDKKENIVYEKKVGTICQEIKIFFQPIISRGFKNLKTKAFLSLFSLNPFRVCKHWNCRMAEYLGQLTSKIDFDLIYFDHDVMLQYLPYLKVSSDTKLIYDEHNITSLSSWRNFLIERKIVSKLAYFLEAIKWYLFERNYLALIDCILTISRLDKVRIEKHFKINRKNVNFLPIPLQVKPLFKFKKKEANILFIGLLSWKPNEDGFWWFLKRVYPKIKLLIPNITLTVIGNYCPDNILAVGRKDPSIKVLGYKKNLDSFYKQASVFIVPIRSGGGIRMKLLNSMSKGIPTVSTSLGAEGIIDKSGKELLLADSPEKFASAVIKIIEREGIANKLSKNSLEYIRKNYSESKTEKVFSDIFDN